MPQLARQMLCRRSYHGTCVPLSDVDLSLGRILAYIHLFFYIRRYMCRVCMLFTGFKFSIFYAYPVGLRGGAPGWGSGVGLRGGAPGWGSGVGLRGGAPGWGSGVGLRVELPGDE